MQQIKARMSKTRLYITQRHVTHIYPRVSYVLLSNGNLDSFFTTHIPRECFESHELTKATSDYYQYNKYTRQIKPAPTPIKQSHHSLKPSLSFCLLPRDSYVLLAAEILDGVFTRPIFRACFWSHEQNNAMM